MLEVTREKYTHRLLDKTSVESVKRALLRCALERDFTTFDVETSIGEGVDYEDLANRLSQFCCSEEQQDARSDCPDIGALA